jgi:hypothetical protein
MNQKQARKRSSLWAHSLSITAAAILAIWIILYRTADPSTHMGAFFGNAIADWTGLLVMVIATKYLYEKGSAESRKPPNDIFGSALEHLRDHSLTIFLLVTGLGWTLLYASMNSESRWGQVVGNIVSEWTQILGLVLMTKVLFERHSKENKH